MEQKIRLPAPLTRKATAKGIITRLTICSLDGGAQSGRSPNTLGYALQVYKREVYAVTRQQRQLLLILIGYVLLAALLCLWQF